MNNDDITTKIQAIEGVINRMKTQQILYPIDEISAKIISDKISGTVTSSTKGATSENQAVNEGGSATYNVLKAPDGFLQITINGVLYYIPVFT